MRAQKIKSGELAINSIQNKDARLVLLASDASEKTKERIHNKCVHYDVEVLMVDDSQQLSQSIGKFNCMYISIIDEGFALKIKNCLKWGVRNGKTKK